MVKNDTSNYYDSDNRRRLLRPTNFVAKPKSASFETPAPACEASALTTELIAPPSHILCYRLQLCKEEAITR